MSFRKHKIFLALFFSVASLSFAAAGINFAPTEQHLPFGTWHRASEAPILSPEGAGWESAGIFNPAVIAVPVPRPLSASPEELLNSIKIVMLYRAQDAAGTSRIGYAESTDGIHFTRRAEPVLSSETDYEKNGGVEDPRLQQFGDTYYLTYTGYNKKMRSFAWPRRKT